MDKKQALIIGLSAIAAGAGIATLNILVQVCNKDKNVIEKAKEDIAEIDEKVKQTIEKVNVVKKEEK